MPRAKSPSLNPPAPEWAWGCGLAQEVKKELRNRIRGSGRAESEVAARLGFGRTFYANLFQTPKGRDPISLRLEVFLATTEVLGIDAEEVLRAAKARLALARRPPVLPPLDPRIEELASRAESLTPEELAELGQAMVRYVRRAVGRPEGSGDPARGRKVPPK
ncbi:MAG TPA: hypothetical protein VF017_04060 [Thermoanaerobaculia bacterium]|nr:hypothetical protein [Thermoanaerobaculia bacterium]